jgi:formylglycine-generating enzyme required for sulfatase activity
MITIEHQSKQEAAVAIRQIMTFEQRYGTETLQLSRCAAFPMALTSDLMYCLRENIQQFGMLANVPWYAISDVLLSTFCTRVGHDLYEMRPAARIELLKGLKPQQLEKLSDFMSEYIVMSLHDSPYRLKLLGDRPKWTVLACLRQIDELLQEIKKDLSLLWEQGENADLFHWSEMIEHYGELSGQPILTKIANDIAAGNLIEYKKPDYTKWAEKYGIKLITQQVLVGKIRFSDAPEPQPIKPLEFCDPNVLKDFEFTVVTVNEQGIEQSRQQRDSRYFIEPLGDIADPQVPCLEMVEIPGGEFMMGSPDDELERFDDESPRHLVQVPPFFMSKYQVTQSQWKAVFAMDKVEIDLDSAPSQFTGENLPVESVSWLQAQEFCARVTRSAERKNGNIKWVCRLPTEAEWEYACRSGTTTPFHFGENISASFANYRGSSTYGQGREGVYQEKTSFVGSFDVANNFGLYDMHGNVWEWCLDNWHDNYEDAPNDGSAWINSKENNDNTHVLRGGSWFVNPNGCRSAFRFRDITDFFNDGVGFRVVYAPARTL